MSNPTPGVTHVFLVVFSFGDVPLSRMGNAVMSYSGPARAVRPNMTTLRAWEQQIREQLADCTVVITNFLPLAS